MNSAETEIAPLSRINTRDGSMHLLMLSPDGFPYCPHCGQEMVRVGDMFENAMCRCWWVGADRIDYHMQVVVHATNEAEDQYRERIAAECREIEARREQGKLQAESRRAALAGKKAITRIHFIDRGYGAQPHRTKDPVEVTIERCYVKRFDVFQGGATEVMDVIYPDGRRFFLRTKQIDHILG